MMQDIETLKGRWLLSQNERDFRVLLESGAAYWRARGFPYPSSTSEEADREMARLRRARPDSADNPFSTSSTIGLRLANAYHPQMWHIRAYGRKRAPIDYFADDAYLKRVLARLPHFWPGRSCWNAQCIRSAFRIASPGRVANFRPVVAKYIVEAFCRRNRKVLDFCAGFGGRMLGALSNPVHYIGVDASPHQCVGLARMAQDLEHYVYGSAEITNGCALQCLEHTHSSSIDLVFSSPPYFNTEIYGSDECQSIVKFPTYNEWLSGFIVRIIDESARVMRPEGTLVLNLGNTRRVKLADDARVLLKRAFGSVREFNLLMRRVPSHPGALADPRVEILFICQQRAKAPL